MMQFKKKKNYANKSQSTGRNTSPCQKTKVCISAWCQQHFKIYFLTVAALVAEERENVFF